MVWYYRSRNAKRRYSHFSRLKGEIKSDFVEVLTDPASFNADIIAYSIMPNHFHLVLRQCTGGLIEHMMRNALISFTRYFNTLKKRKGPLFFTQFKAVRIQSHEQLIHITRYVHLNHFSSGLILELSKLTEAPSSYHVYVHGGKDLLVDYEILKKLFGGNKHRYKNFVEQNAEYQKTLEYIKHTKKWNV